MNGITDEEREFAAAVYAAINEGGVFPKGHPHEGLTKEEAIARANEERQNPVAEAPVTGKLPPVAAASQAPTTGKKKVVDAEPGKTG